MSLLMTELQIQIADYSTLTIGAFRYEENAPLPRPIPTNFTACLRIDLRSCSTLSSMSRLGTGTLVFLSSVGIDQNCGKTGNVSGHSCSKIVAQMQIFRV